LKVRLSQRNININKQGEGSMKILTITRLRASMKISQLVAKIHRVDVDVVVVTDVSQDVFERRLLFADDSRLAARITGHLRVGGVFSELVREMLLLDDDYHCVWSMKSRHHGQEYGIGFIFKHTAASWQKWLTSQSDKQMLHVLQCSDLTIAVMQVSHRRWQSLRLAEVVTDFLKPQLNPVVLLTHRKICDSFIQAGWVPCESVALKVDPGAIQNQLWLTDTDLKIHEISGLGPVGVSTSVAATLIIN
jgi:hypothetical protein